MIRSPYDPTCAHVHMVIDTATGKKLAVGTQSLCRAYLRLHSLTVYRVKVLYHTYLYV